MYQPRNAAGVTWADVTDCMRLISRGRNVRVHIYCGIKDINAHKVALKWRIEAYSHGVWPPKAPKTAVEFNWPANQFRTIAAALLWHLHTLGEQLEEKEHAAQLGLPF